MRRTPPPRPRLRRAAPIGALLAALLGAAGASAQSFNEPELFTDGFDPRIEPPGLVTAPLEEDGASVLGVSLLREIPNFKTPPADCAPIAPETSGGPQRLRCIEGVFERILFDGQDVYILIAAE